MNKTQKILQNRLEKQELFLQGLLNRVEELEKKISNKPVEKHNESHPSDAQIHLLEDLLDNSYSPPPLPPPLQDSNLPSMPLPPSATPLSQLRETSSTPVQSQPSQQPYISLSTLSQGSIPPFSPTCDISQTCAASQLPESVQCLPITQKPSTATLPADAVDKAKLASPAQTLHRYPKLHTEGRASVLAVKLARESFFGETTMSQCTVMGCGKYPALPATQLNMLKQTLFTLFPRYWSNPVLFEGMWKDCAEAIGQACKRIRVCTAVHRICPTFVNMSHTVSVIALAYASLLYLLLLMLYYLDCQVINRQLI